jgi:hypothetical protein
MVSADKGGAIEFSFAEQGALVWAAAFEGAPSAPGANQNDVRSVREDRKRTGALEFAEVGDANEWFGLHEPLSPRKLENVLSTPGWRE